MSESELKPCPFCGGSNLLTELIGITCRSCHAQVLGAANDDDVTTWNRRPTPLNKDAEAVLLGRGEGALARALDFIESLTADPLLMGVDDIEMTLADVQAHAGIELSSIRRQLHRAADGWQPIETAPKDGTTVILFCPQGDGNPGSECRVTSGEWCDEPGHEDGNGGEVVGFTGWLSWDGGFSEDTMMPTHWMPLPHPPTSQINASEANRT